MNLRGAKPITDNSIKEFIVSLTPVEDLYNNDIQHQFTENFFNWINSSSKNNLKGLENFALSIFTLLTIYNIFSH
jgi:hypothetical protein